MRIVHDDYRGCAGLVTGNPLPPPVAHDLAEVHAVHPIESVKVTCYAHAIISVTITLAEAGGAMQVVGNWTAADWGGKTIRKISHHMETMREHLAVMRAKPVTVDRCAAILAAGHMDGRAFRRELASKMPIVTLHDARIRTIAVWSGLRENELIRISVPNVNERNLRVQVQTWLHGITLVDRTITLDRAIELPETLLNALDGTPIDRIVAGTPLDGHGILAKKAWVNGKSRGARLSIMARPDPLSLDDAVALIDRLHRPARMAA